MQKPPPPELSETDPGRPHGIAQDYASPSNLYDEMLGQDGKTRPHWDTFVAALEDLGTRELRGRWQQAQRTIHENGITHNVYGDPQGLERPWNLDLIPLLLSAGEWRTLCLGLIQRATLLDSLLADLYGPARCVREGLLPPELVWANPAFLRACHGVALPHNRWLHLYAADLARTAEGGFEVLSDRTQAPSGAGYSLENRIVLSRMLPGAFRQCNVERLAPFFASLRETLASFAPAGGDNPRIVLLTPGPYNETYFEQSFLANYLGYALVQGNDLTVRDSKVYLKTVGSLQRVDVILRRVDDHFCDPLELLSASYLGVPGLLESVHRGNVVVANALGTGVLQAPGFLPFLPGLCRHFLGEEMRLPSVPTWWCGQPAELQYVLEHLQQLVIKSAYPTRGEDPVFGQELTEEELAALAAKIKASPGKYVGQEQGMAGTTPALIDDHLQPRRFVLRPFLAVRKDSYEVMNGALTRTTHSEDSLVVSLQRGGGSKDTWILSDGEVSQMTLLTLTHRSIPFSRGVGDLLSRFADEFFWLGRYAERAMSQMRLARAALGHLVEERGGPDSPSGQVLAATLQGGYTRPYRAARIEAFIEDVMGPDESGGLRGVTGQLFGLTRALRDRLPSDAWRIALQLSEKMSDYAIDPSMPATGWVELLDAGIAMVAAFVGLADDAMMGSRSWKFLDMGKRIERCIFTTGLLAGTVTHPGGDPDLLESVLEITESSFPYRRRYLMRLEVSAIVDLVLADQSNPHAVVFQLGRIARHLAKLPRDPGSAKRDVQLLMDLRGSIQAANLAELCEPAADGSRDALEEFLYGIVDRMAKVADAVAEVYFSHSAMPRELSHLDEELDA